MVLFAAFIVYRSTPPFRSDRNARREEFRRQQHRSAASERGESCERLTKDSAPDRRSRDPGTRKNVKDEETNFLDSSKLRNNEVRQKVPSLGKTNNKNRNQLKGTRMSPLPENRENIWTLLIESAGFRSHRRRFLLFVIFWLLCLSLPQFSCESREIEMREF